MSHALHQIMSRPRWTPEEARVVLDGLDASGLTVSEFAIRHGVQAQRLYAWRRKLSEDRAPPAMASFIEVAAVGPSRPVGRFELVLSSGDTLRVEGGFDTDSVRRLLGLLREPRGC